MISSIIKERRGEKSKFYVVLMMITIFYMFADSTRTNQQKEHQNSEET